MSAKKQPAPEQQEEQAQQQEPPTPTTVHGKPDRRFIENREDLQEVHRRRQEEGKE